MHRFRRLALLLTTASDSATLEHVRSLLGPIMAAREARDSLAALADTATGERAATLEERVWQRQIDVMNGLLAATSELETLQKRGADLSEALPVIEKAIRSGWPRYLRQLQRRETMMVGLFERRDAASPDARLAIEAEIAENAERTVKMYRDLVDALLAVERLGIDIGRQRLFVVERMTAAADQTVARLTVLGREQAVAAARVQRSPDDAAARTALEASDAGVNRTAATLDAAIALLERLGHDATELKVSQILATGRLTAAIFEPGVIGGLVTHWRQEAGEKVATRGAHWLFQAVLVVLTLVGFALLARVIRWVVRRGVARADVSQLLKETAIGWASKFVMLVGIIVVLRQLGVQLAPMLAGLGIAGVVLGFALQDTLANFAAGAMILAHHPYDVGDIIEVAGAMGTVRKMTLVSTTVLTFDNQTLVVPNKKVWGDVIRNITAQPLRRVDLTFGVGYDHGIDEVERLLEEILRSEPRVLPHPAPIVKLHQLAESSMNYTVRAWTKQELYWDVYWDLTRAVKVRFDREGIKFPFPQRELHVNMNPGAAPEPPGRGGPTAGSA